MELNPSYATAHHWYSFWFMGMGQLDKAIESVSKASELDPVSQAIVKDKGIMHYYNRDFKTAVNLANETLELDPTYPAAHRLLSLSYQELGDVEKAVAENQRWGSLTGNIVEAKFCLAQIYAQAGEHGRARELIGEIDLETNSIDNVYRGLALAYASLGEVRSGI